MLFTLLACQPVVNEPTQSPQLPDTSTPISTALDKIEPSAVPLTIPTLRSDQITYLAQSGDTLSSIASAYDLLPQTVLWANYELLFDNPDFLSEGMSLVILPADGLMHQVGGIDTLESIAAFFLADPDSIRNWPANQLSSNSSNLQAGQWLFIPEGLRQSRWRQMPDISRTAANLDAAEFGLGACLENYQGGSLGDGQYVWPVESQSIRAESFSSWHPGLDLATNSGELVNAADDGLVVYSGWSNFGYGNLVMLDHGRGDYSLYSGLSELIAPCGQSVLEGDPIARAAITGHPAGPILHFEIRHAGSQIDPLSVLP